MTIEAISIPLMEPMEQLEQLGSACKELLSATFAKTKETYQRVLVTKKDERGNIKVYNEFKDSKIVRTYHEVPYMLETSSGELYLENDHFTNTSKCAALLVGTPIYTFAKMTWEVLKTPFELMSIALRTLKAALESLFHLEISKSLDRLWQGSLCLLNTMSYNLFSVVTAPLFGLGIQLAALYGCFQPYQGRAIVAKIENAWHRGVSYKEDYRHLVKFQKQGEIPRCFSDILEQKPLYLAYCFQSRGNIKGPEIASVVTSS